MRLKASCIKISISLLQEEFMISWPIVLLITIVAIVLSWYGTRLYYLPRLQIKIDELKVAGLNLLNLKLGISLKNTSKILGMLKSELNLRNGKLKVEKIYDAYNPNPSSTRTLIEVRIEQEDQLSAPFFEVFIDYSDIQQLAYTLKEGDKKCPYSDNQVAQLLSHAKVIVEMWGGSRGRVTNG